MQVALIGVSHWHVPMYMEYLAEIDDVEVVAVSDPNPDAVAAARERFPAARAYGDYRELLDREDPDLIMAHAPHDQMTELAQAELANVQATLPLVEFDSRLGWEPSMEYMCDPAHIEWKIDQLRTVLDTEIPACRQR